MIRNIPCKYSEQALMDILNKSGFFGSYESVSVPHRVYTKKDRMYNYGYAFVAFKDAKSAASFTSYFDGFNFPGHGKIARVEVAHRQSFQQAIPKMRIFSGRKWEPDEGWIW